MFVKFLKIALSACIIIINTSGSHAQDYPARTVKIVVPSGAGGGTDSVARVFAQKMAAGLGQPVIVDNKPGAGSQLGVELVAAAPADGYTLLFSSSSPLTLPYLRKTKFELSRDFIPVGQVGVGTFALVVNPKLPMKSLAEFLAAVKANPKKYSYGSAGTGSAGHLGGELLKSKAGIDMLHVPFKSNSEMSQALMGGQIDFSIDVLATQKSQIDAQLVRGLATTGSHRDSSVPNLPTFNETKLIPGGYELTYWFAMFLPANTPAPIVERVQREFAAAMKDPEVQQRIKGFSLTPSTMTAAEFRADIAAETAKWKKVIADTGIRLE